MPGSPMKIGQTASPEEREVAQRQPSENRRPFGAARAVESRAMDSHRHTRSFWQGLVAQV